jgi:hypothetical protein
MEAIRRERLLKYKLGNAKLGVEVQKLRAQVGNIEDFKQEVLAANATVRQQLLALAFQLPPQLLPLTDVRAMQKLIHDSLVKALNDLAFEPLRVVTECATCGQPIRPTLGA